MPVQLLTKSVIEAEVSGVRYENQDTGFAVIQLLVNDGHRISACGKLSGLKPGDFVQLNGQYERDERFGLQFRADSFQIQLPKTIDGIERYLVNCVEGIGPKTAKLIVNHFGINTVNILTQYPKRLREISGIGTKKYQTIIQAWQTTQNRRDSLIFLQSLGISKIYCDKLFRLYGENAASTVKQHPYKLAGEIPGIGFARADAIAREVGISQDAPERLLAAALFAMNNLVSNGHVGVPSEALLKEIISLIKCPLPDARRAIELAIEQHRIIEDHNWIYHKKLFYAETRLPELLKQLSRCSEHAGAVLSECRFAGHLAECQTEALSAVAKHPVSIITGGPGVGKTTVIGELTCAAQKKHLKTALAAPTGRAAKRLSEASGLEAKTVHRLLMYDPVNNGFSCDEDNPLDCDLLIIDECSMLDINLAFALFCAVQPGTTVVLVGDADQLPPVGPGKFFTDLIESGCVPVTRLTQVFRQAQNSRIIESAHRVNRGLLPEKAAAGEISDFYWIEQDDPEKVLKTIQTLITERIPEKFNFDPQEDIQLLTPMNRSSCGSIALNRMLCSKINPNRKQPPEPESDDTQSFPCPGDKVMQNCNDYDKGVFNGDFGYVSQVDRDSGKFTVCFDGENFVDYQMDEISKLTLGYAVTIHKSQGCEFPVVIVPLLSQHYMMLQRNLLYTAMTRAKKLLILIGSRKNIASAAGNFRQEPRFSRLQERLCRLFMTTEIGRDQPFERRNTGEAGNSTDNDPDKEPLIN